MTDLDDLYEEVILDHYRNPRNHHAPAHADQSAEGYNPLCGDRLKVFVRLRGDRVEAVGFEGAGCAISLASASVMTTVVEGKTREEIAALFERFQKLVTGRLTDANGIVDLGDLASLSGVCKFPTRVKCATLSWHAMLAALENRPESVSTE